MGPLRRSESGTSLPLKDLKILKYKAVSGKGQVLASFADGTAFLTRFNSGKGYVYYCSTKIDRQWSNLLSGGVLVPFLHRLQEVGSRRHSDVVESICGDYKIVEGAESLTSKKGGVFAANHSGVFKTSSGLTVLNRPAVEDSAGFVEEEKLQELFGAVSFNLQEAVQKEDAGFKTKLWGMFLTLLFFVFIIENWLTRKPKPVNHEMPTETSI